MREIMTTKHENETTAATIEILVAEDSPTQAQHLVRLLASQPGWRVHLVADGAQALARIRTAPPDLVISDVAMPGMDGYTLCRTLKDDPALAGVPLLLLTSMASLHDIVRALEAGADAFIRKPFDADALLGRVRRMLDERHEGNSGGNGASGTGVGPLDFMAGERHEIYELLVATHDQALRLNAELDAQRASLAQLHARAEALVVERTQALRSERNRLSAIVATTGALVLLTDPEGRIVMFNRACEEALGWCAAQAIGQRCWDVVRGADDPDIIKRLFGRMQAGELPVAIAQQLQGEWRRPDGALRYIIWTNTVIRDADRAVEYVLGTGIDVTELRGAEARLRYISTYDALTGLPNRAWLRGRLAQMKPAARADGTLLGFMLVRFGRMALIREALGPGAEQALLQQAAARLRELGLGEAVARFSEDAFAAVAVCADADEVAAAARRLVAALSAPYQHEGEEFHLDPCVGITVFPNDGVDYEMLAKGAEAALRQACDSVGQRFAFYRPEFNQGANDRFKLESALRRAVERNELELHYQPQLTMSGGTIVSAEALLRWRHPERGMVPPNTFIPLAEESGLILPIGEWVLREACRQICVWQRAGLPVVPVGVNLSALQLTGDIVPTVRRILDEYEVDPALLELELTESASMADAGKTCELLVQLKAMGFRLAIDDFGTGYSNLNYLKRFPVDKLKLDRSFVRDIEDDPDDLAISRAVIGMAHGLHLTVVAEGVETAGQLALLAELGCDQVQGFLFSRAVPAADFAGMLAAGRIVPG
jgi:PAS domain S-box-containing protein/diguanylate cyclase (GGDEF)-like protein